MSLAVEANAPSLDLGLSKDRIAETFAPFVARDIGPGETAEWSALIAGRGKKILKRRLRRQLLGWMSGAGRPPEVVEGVYEKTWTQTSLDNLVDPKARAVPCVWGPQRMMAAGQGLKRVHLLHLMRLIEQLQPKSVLEVGCGIGINLLILAARFPDITFNGIDLTARGIASIQEISAQDTLPQVLLDYSPEPARDAAAHRRIQVQQGSAAAMPYGDNEFDLIYSVAALEQMEAIRPRVMAELKRVSRGHVAMVEAFRDWNLSGMRRNYIVAQDYFSARLSDLPKYGLQPVLATDDMPTKVNMGLGLVVAAT
ncbi:MAG: class I SAM-dependent methyltransferase [Rhodospirillaceae bacterium]|jgi:SAM-dependent methyltransferase|nr:class I SAM-dependent methyltransferase [Rhodospirillaceae bacterium]MBT4488290.1 class I SAM-dependent methyltransferase [Rhodospirillaceae bacterium]MBT5898742.1 class I SAM-dependent methyltransferase [Rhodospirillaceae bacterium]MBT6427850.1 class I SAM-dependent methyltransferase [Rhodospirillaceae bacterium]MBT7756557.1 class I SAM-dependent methyltransferase [Rhodospirillaceae bacterium]